jgi:hypothetical protein
MARTGRKSTSRNHLFSCATVAVDWGVRQAPAGKDMSMKAEDDVVSSRYLPTTSEQAEDFTSDVFLVIYRVCKSVISF